MAIAIIALKADNRHPIHQFGPHPNGANYPHLILLR